MDVRRKMLMKKPSYGGSGGGSTSGSYTVVLNDQWRLSTNISNPDSSTYEGVYESNSNYNVNSGVSTMYITIKGCSSFKMYIRSYAESNYDYVMVSQLDKTITGSTSYNDTTLVKAHTRGNQQSGTALSSYTLVEFTGISSGEHTITIVYRKDSSVNNGNDRGYVLIPKGQGSSDSGGGSGSGDIITDDYNYMTIYALEDGLQAKLSGNAISYSLDEGNTWTELASNTYTPTVNSGQTIMFKGNLTPTSSKGIGTFTINKRCNLMGNCNSLLFGDAASNNSLSNKSYAFYKLFNGCTTIVEVSSTFLPATTLVWDCYSRMFMGCTSLVNTPTLPATVLTVRCYSSMFSGCSSLVNVSELPATTLKAECYYSMFKGCTSLVNAPELPATVLDTYCYKYMFQGCTSLTVAPELPATTLASMCYEYMFQSCTGLVNTPALPATTLAGGCYSHMFDGTNVLPDCSNINFSNSAIVSSGGLRDLFAGTKVTNADLFNILPINPSTGKYWLPSTTLADSCYSGMFSDCSSLVTAPELPATILADYCYSSMFSNCTSLVTAPSLPATTLDNGCYQGMFSNCSRLVNAPSLPATRLSRECYYGMFKNCTSLVNAPALPATTLAIQCYYSMFYGCSSLVAAPALLPATILYNGCYSYMFKDCSSLTTAPELPATTLKDRCYYYMFHGCRKLNYIKMLATNISASDCLYGWVSSVASTGTFVKYPNMTSLSTGSSGIPSGWTVYNAGDANEPERPEVELSQVAGDVAYYTNGEIKTISASKWNSSLGTPIGVVVIPSNFLPDGKTRILSLKAVDSSGNATTSHSNMKWSSTSRDTTLTNYTKVPITNNTGSVSSSSNSHGYLPSDNFTGDTSFVDGSAKYGTTNTSKIPSPYNGNEFNTDYSKTISGYNNALSDFNGLSNTQVLVGLGSDYVAANAAYNYSDGASNIQWYLPSAGELGFLVARLKTINSIISQLGGVAVPSHNFRSSTEYSKKGAYYVGTSDGGVFMLDKGYGYYVRPFALLDNNDGAD